MEAEQRTLDKGGTRAAAKGDGEQATGGTSEED